MSEMMDFLQTMKADINAKFQSLDGKLMSLDIKLNILSGDLNILSNNFDSFKGDTNERLMREKVQKLYGDSFSRRFVVQGLSGLVRLLIPPRKETSLYHPRDISKDCFKYSDPRGLSHEPSDMQSQQEGIHEIVSFIHKKNAPLSCFKLLLCDVQNLMPNLFTSDEVGMFIAQAGEINFFSSSDLGPNKDPMEQQRLLKIRPLLDIESKLSSAEECQCNNLLLYFFKFIQLKKGEQIKELLSDSGIGLLLFCSCIPDIEPHFPIVDLEFDCRGDIEQISIDNKNVTVISAGEIKSSASGIQKAKVQLSKRLLVTKEALKLMPNYKGVESPQISLRGIIFLPASESKNMTGRNLSPPTSSEYNLDVVYC